MKTKMLAIGLAFASTIAFAQKREIKDAEKAIEDGKFEEAQTILKSVEGQIQGEKDKIKEDFYLVKGNAYKGRNPQNQSVENLKMAGEAYKKAIELGNDDAKNMLQNLRASMVESAVSLQDSKKFKDATDLLYTSYNLNKKDTLYLYYAAASATNAKDYDTALEYYEDLADMNFSGETKEYYAVEKASGEKRFFDNKQQRDIFVKSGEYINPTNEMSGSKRPEIYKNIALLYIQKDESEKGMQAINKALSESPDDTQLLLAQADVYYQSGDKKKYSEIVEKVIKKEPNNARLYYNLGVTASDMGDEKKAIDYYKSAIEINPDMINAYINLSTSILAREKPLIEEMNGLGMSDADNKRYEELKNERKELYKEAAPYLEKAVEINPDNQQALQTLVNIYQQLGNEAKTAKYKGMMN